MKEKKLKKRWIVLGVFIALLAIAYWYLFLGSPIEGVSDKVTKGDQGTKSLIVYFTRVGTTKAGIDAESAATPSTSGENKKVSDTQDAVNMIQNITGADTYQVYPKRYYRNSFMGTAATGWIEEALNMRPNVAAMLENLDQYDTIYVGYPIWWYHPPMVMGTFLENYNLEGKTIVPFATSTDSPIDVSMDYVKEITKGATVTEGLRINNSTKQDVQEWLKKIGTVK